MAVSFQHFSQETGSVSCTVLAIGCPISTSSENVPTARNSFECGRILVHTAETTAAKPIAAI
jgi:hypothetical protein